MNLPTYESANAFFLRPSMQSDPSQSGHTARHPIVAIIMIVCVMSFGVGVVVGYALGQVAQ